MTSSLLAWILLSLIQQRKPYLANEMKSKIQFASDSTLLCEGSFSLTVRLTFLLLPSLLPGWGWMEVSELQRKFHSFSFFIVSGEATTTLMIVALHCEYFHMLTIISIEWRMAWWWCCVVWKRETVEWGEERSTLPLCCLWIFGDDGGAKQWENFSIYEEVKGREMEMRENTEENK